MINNQANSVIKKNAIILNIIQDIFNRRDTEASYNVSSIEESRWARHLSK